MAAPLRSLSHRATFPSSVQGVLRQTTTRLPHSAHRAAAIANARLHTNSGSSSHDDQEDTSIRERAIKAREPSYAGWWTEVMNYHTAPQTSVDPSAPSIPYNNSNNNGTTTPSSDEIQKGYGNTLPRARPSLEYNTLPRAASTGSATFVTGTGSTLSAPAAESTDYHGFKVPVKPSPPGAEDCCMSGCAHCIYDIYEEDRQEYKAKLAKVLDEISKAGIPPPPNIKKGKGGGGASTGNAQSANDEEDDMDPGMKAFLELERKLKGS
ncbi:hypothetical protein KI688_002671 [Linnemannia hyalina]|uniref:Oxidoreductase-like domain-containing protein n=1 Tax=Linnemannia hyalina TaxID=64524 RepID=A0A9P7XQK9_9FUNG|nr:hypothetical protein KI688_002671 [Linnemannia hyalina]